MISASPSPLICKARQFVFAMGAIENVRHLLILNQQNSDRSLDIGRNLGRFYMQHLHQELGQFVILKDAAPAFAKSVRSTFIAATEKYLRHRGHGAFRLYSTRLTDCCRSHRQISQRSDRGVVPRRSLGWNGFHHLRAGSECREPSPVERQRRRIRAAAHQVGLAHLRR